MSEITGLLGNSGDLQNLAGNPLFNVGMSLLQSSYDPRVNPFGAAMGGLQQANQYQRLARGDERTAAQDTRAQQLRDMLAKYFESQQQPQPPQQPTAIDALSPSVQRGLAASSLDPQNAELYRRMAWREMLGGF